MITCCQCTFCPELRTEDSHLARDPSVPGAPQALVALCEHLLFPSRACKGNLEVVSRRLPTYKAASALPPCLVCLPGLISRPINRHRIIIRAPREPKLSLTQPHLFEIFNHDWSPGSSLNASLSASNSLFVIKEHTTKPGFVHNQPVNTRNDARSETFSASSLPRPPAEPAFAPSSQERVKTGGRCSRSNNRRLAPSTSSSFSRQVLPNAFRSRQAAR